MSATGQVLAGRYVLTRWVGGGSMGEVWEATDQRMDLRVAVKVLKPAHVNDPVAIERFQIEARLGARLDHPGIAKVHDISVEATGDEPPWMVQEFVNGEPLTEVIGREGALEPARAALIIAQAAEAAHAAHQIGVVHRDLTPRNLLVTAGNVVKVTDFGIARADAGAGLTVAGHVIGTPAYLSPEQVRGVPATPASDVYTLAVTLYECLAGTRPFTGNNAIEVARAHLDRVAPSLPTSIPGPLRALVVAAMAKEPEHRPSTIEFARRLRGATLVRPVGVTGPIEPVTRIAPPVPVGNGGQHRVSAARPVIPSSARPPQALGRIGSEFVSRYRTVAAQVVPVLRHALDRTRDHAWPEATRRGRAAWSQARTMRAGLVGAALILVAVIAVLSSGAG